MPVTVANITQAKTKRSLRVLLGNKWYGAYLDSGLEKGMIIEPVIETSEKAGPWIVKWTPAEGHTLPESASAEPEDERNPPAEGESATPQPARERQASNMIAPPYWLPFVSNTIAHAITAGHIREPGQIGAWAKAAAETAIALETLG